MFPQVQIKSGPWIKAEAPGQQHDPCTRCLLTAALLVSLSHGTWRAFLSTVYSDLYLSHTCTHTHNETHRLSTHSDIPILIASRSPTHTYTHMHTYTPYIETHRLSHTTFTHPPTHTRWHSLTHWHTQDRTLHTTLTPSQLCTNTDSHKLMNRKAHTHTHPRWTGTSSLSGSPWGWTALSGAAAWNSKPSGNDLWLEMFKYIHFKKQGQKQA